VRLKELYSFADIFGIFGFVTYSSKNFMSGLRVTNVSVRIMNFMSIAKVMRFISVLTVMKLYRFGGSYVVILGSDPVRECMS
jgi:hypothetical protein